MSQRRRGEGQPWASPHPPNGSRAGAIDSAAVLAAGTGVAEARDDTELVEQPREQPVIGERRRDIVRTPRKGADARRAGARRTAGHLFELEQGEVVDAGARQPPRRGKTGNPGPDDDDVVG